MDSDGNTLQPDELLAQLGWVRALAQRLVADPEVTDDVLQQVCLLALQQAPREAQTGPRLRAWLATATRRLAQHAGRASARRQRRERAAARPEALPSTADVAVHREALRGLVDAVTALEEPAYSVLVARYFEGRSVAEIAAQSGASADAVRQRLSRARQQLRARLQQLLDEDRSGRLRALLPLAPVAGALESAGSASTLGKLGGVLVAKTLGTGVAKVVVGLVVLCCVLVGTWYAVGDSWRASADGAPGGRPLGSADAGAAESALPAPALAAAEQLVGGAAADGAPANDSTHTPATYPPGITTYVVSGRVVDARGVPWPGAIVRSVLDETTGGKLGIKTQSYEIELDELESTTTDEHGRFALTNPWAPASGIGRVLGQTPEPVLIVEAEGMAHHVFPLANHDGHDRDLGDLVLSTPAASIVARVVDEGGLPIAGVAAGIYSWGGADAVKGRPGFPESREFNIMGLTRVHSDAQGRVEIGGLWPSECVLSLHDASHERRKLRDLRVDQGQNLNLGDVVLERGGQLAGVVRDQLGQPVANAEMWAWDAGTAYAQNIGGPEPDDWQRADPLPAVIDALHDARTWHTDRSPVTSDAEGRFNKSGLTGELKDVFVEAAGFEPLRVPGVPLESAQLELVLSPETNMDVLVVDDRSGAVLAGAALQAFRCSEIFGYAKQRLAIERLVTPGAVPGAFVVHTIGKQGTRLHAGAPGHATQTVEVAQAAALTPVIVRLGPARAATGRVEDAKGQPVPDAVATLRPGTPPVAAEAASVPPADDKREARTDAQGAFRFDDLPSGAFTLDVSAAGFASAPARTIELGSAAAQALPTVVLQPACSITGTVSHADGTPAEGLLVSLPSPGGTRMGKVDRSGGFAFQDLDSGTRTLRVAEQLGTRPLIDLEIALGASEARVLSLALPRPPVLRGRVTSGGVPVADTRLRAVEQPHDSKYSAVSVSQPCDADGRVTLELPLDGTYRLRAERNGGGATAWITLDAPWGLERSFDFELGGGSIAGRVADASDGSVPPDIEVSLARDGEPATDWLATGPAGTFDIQSLLPGEYSIHARSKTYPESGLDVHLDAGQRLADVVVPIALGAVIDGLVLDSHGQPDGSWVFLVTPGDPPTAVRYGAPQGSFHIEGVAPGHYRIVVADGNYADDLLDPHMADAARASEQASVEIDLKAGEQRRVTLQTGK